MQKRYKILVALFQEKHHYVYALGNPTTFAGSPASVWCCTSDTFKDVKYMSGKQLASIDVIYADPVAKTLLEEHNDIDAPIIAFEFPRDKYLRHFDPGEITVEESELNPASETGSRILIHRIVSRPKTKPREVYEPATTSEAPKKKKRVKKEKKPWVSPNPTARQKEGEPKVWIIDCADCGTERECHKADLHQVTRCKPCQKAYSKEQSKLRNAKRKDQEQVEESVEVTISF